MTAANAFPGDRPKVAIALVGSSITAIGAELATQMGGYEKAVAIVRRGAVTTLPVAENGSAWVDRLKFLKTWGARKHISATNDHLTELVGGQPFDCFIHHSSNAFSQVLSSHPLCRNYFYLEEGLTALVGGKFGRPKKRRIKQMVSKLRSIVFFGGKVDKFRPFFDTSRSNYGGACAVSSHGFKGFPGRIQLPFDSLDSEVPAPAEVLIFLDSQYFQLNCTPEQYLAALVACLESVVKQPSRAAIKFHPGEKDESRRKRFRDAILGVASITDLMELPTIFYAERTKLDPQVKVVVGTTALGFYMGERGFETYTFAPRIAPSSPRFAKVVSGLPPEFLEVCRPG